MMCLHPKLAHILTPSPPLSCYHVYKDIEGKGDIVIVHFPLIVGTMVFPILYNTGKETVKLKRSQISFSLNYNLLNQDISETNFVSELCPPLPWAHAAVGVQARCHLGLHKQAGG